MNILHYSRTIPYLLCYLPTSGQFWRFLVILTERPQFFYKQNKRQYLHIVACYCVFMVTDGLGVSDVMGQSKKLI